MSTKDPTTNEQPHDSNEPPQPPPPSYAESGAFAPKTADSTSPAPAGQGSSGGVYQAQAYPPAAPGQAYHPPPPGSAAPFGPPDGVYPSGPPGSVYPPGPPGGQPYGPPGSRPQGQPGAANFPQPPPGTSAVIYVVDDPAPNSAAIPRRRGMPMAMLFFILGREKQ
ncbi:hypothetical protein BGW42_000088 [Actinomortierella wolfii]|nr:hypothetical protein BGW42_000088 [Actinomortierella wolfii]